MERQLVNKNHCYPCKTVWSCGKRFEKWKNCDGKEYRTVFYSYISKKKIQKLLDIQAAEFVSLYYTSGLTTDYFLSLFNTGAFTDLTSVNQIYSLISYFTLATSAEIAPVLSQFYTQLLVDNPGSTISKVIYLTQVINWTAVTTEVITGSSSTGTLLFTQKSIVNYNILDCCKLQIISFTSTIIFNQPYPLEKLFPSLQTKSPVEKNETVTVEKNNSIEIITIGSQ